MAGGKGLRLHALTQKTPKPMLPVGSKPMLETLGAIAARYDTTVGAIASSGSHHARSVATRSVGS